MARALLATVVLLVFLVEYASGSVCKQTYSATTYSDESYYVSCGWWNWGRCTRTRKVSNIETKTRDVCCTGSYGSVGTGCVGVCPYSDALSSSACPGNRVCRDHQCDKSGVNDSPTPAALTFHENNDKEQLLWTVDAQCFVQESCPCARRRRETDGIERKKRALCTCSKMVPCTHCSVQSTDGIAEVRNGVEIYRKTCNHTTCRDCRKFSGCLDYNVNYAITVECRADGYIYNDAVSQSFNLNVTKAQVPAIELPHVDQHNPVILNTGATVGDTLLTIDDIIIPDSEKVTYKVDGPVSSNTGKDLFVYNETTMEIVVNSDLSEEQSAVYTLDFCVEYRRGATCKEIVVKIERLTTSTQSLTTQPEDEEYMCIAEGDWKSVPGMDFWCNSICSKLGDACPYLHTHCSCLNIATERVACRGYGLYAGLPSMDVWCEMNCNMGNSSHCPTDTSLNAYCTCN